MSFYGYWPSFHDANVSEYRTPSLDDPSLGFTLHTWEMTKEVDAKGYFILHKHALVKFHFDGLTDVQMDAFGTGNILFGMNLIKANQAADFSVELNSIMAMPGSFNARNGVVVSVIPCTPDGEPI